MKNLYLIGIPEVGTTIQYSQVLPRSAGVQTKHYADTLLHDMDEDFRNAHRFFVVASENEVSVGETVAAEKMDICFRLI